MHRYRGIYRQPVGVVEQCTITGRWETLYGVRKTVEVLHTQDRFGSVPDEYMCRVVHCFLQRARYIHTRVIELTAVPAPPRRIFDLIIVGVAVPRLSLLGSKVVPNIEPASTEGYGSDFTEAPTF